MVACVLVVRWAATIDDPAQALLTVGQRFSPRVAWVEPRALAIDLHGLSRLFGEPRAIGEELRRALAQAQLETHIAIAGTRTAARLLANGGDEDKAPDEEAWAALLAAAHHFRYERASQQPSISSNGNGWRSTGKSAMLR